MSPVMDFDFDAEKRWLNSRFLVPSCGIRVTRHHLDSALSKKREGIIGERDLVDWATMILMNSAYELDPKDEQLIADWLNDISFDLNPSRD